MLKSNLITKTKAERLYQIPVPIIGLTGGIATGKSTAANMFREKKIPIIDADALVKKVYQKPEVIQFIKDNFSEAIVDNAIDFKILRKIAFNKKENIARIEQVIYQYLPNQFLEEFNKFENPEFIIYDVPLLFEKGLDKLVDIKACVYLPRSMQIERLMERDHIDEDQAEAIIDHQMSIEDKKNQSDFIILNISSLDFLEVEVGRFLKKILDQ